MSQLTLPGHNLGRKWHQSAVATQTSLKQLLCSLTGSFSRNIHSVSAYPGTGTEKQQYKMSDRACQGLSAWEGFHCFSWAQMLCTSERLILMVWASLGRRRDKTFAIVIALRKLFKQLMFLQLGCGEIFRFLKLTEVKKKSCVKREPTQKGWETHACWVNTTFPGAAWLTKAISVTSWQFSLHLVLAG